jgi:eukaryotic-like serine/threonine-protein kinase
MTAEFSTGQHIGDYQILSILGLGGMGKVYKVRNIISDRIEAMKILLPDLTSNQGLADRFLREIRLLATLNHPNIAALRTALTHENQLVMIMEFVEGETLANRLARAPISTAEAIDFSDQCLSALSYAHKQNIIHRDIKPANMMLTPQGIVKLMDFGIARSSTDGALTSTGTTLGSLNYMPPEQVRGETADARSDIYSFGVSLYEMLTGKLPFHGDSQYSLMTAHLNHNPPEPITLRSDLPTSLNEIIMMAMAKDRADRFQSAEAFRNALKTVPVLPAPAASTTETPTPKPRPVSSATTLVETPLPPRAATSAMPPPNPTPTPAPRATPTPTPGAAEALPPTVPQPLPVPPSAHSGFSSRGLWLALGSLVGVSVLLAAGIYIPRHLRTHADPDKAMFPSNSNGSTTSTPAPADTSGNPSAPVTPPAASALGGPAGINVGANGRVSIHSPEGDMQIGGDTGSVAIHSPKGDVQIGGANGSVAVSTPDGGSVNVGGKAGAKSSQPSSNSGNPKPRRDSNAQGNNATPPPAPAGPSPEELARLDDVADKLNIREATMSRSLDALRQQQERSGYGLRADMASAEERAKAYLAKGNSALSSGDTVNALKYFDLADTEISKLEKFLGH